MNLNLKIYRIIQNTCKTPTISVVFKRCAIDNQFDSKYNFKKEPEYIIPKLNSMNEVNVEKIKEAIKENDEFFAVVFFDQRPKKLLKDDVFYVDHIDTDLGKEIIFGKVLMAGSENVTLLGKPLLSIDLVQVKATVVEHFKRKMIISYINKGPHSSKKTKCTLPKMTALRVTEIKVNPAYLYWNGNS